jgi:UDP-glucose 4-epimerase
MARCLVTGHQGYIGSRVYERLLELGHEVRGIDLKQGLDVIKDLDHEDYKSFRPEYIFHLAAIPRVPYSMEFPEEVLENNILSTIRILEYARKSGTRRVVYSSSSSVVGNGNGPTSPYGASKLVPEILCKNYSDVYGLDTVCLRYFNVYSEDQTVDGPYATAIANFMHCIREGKGPYITGDGEQRRDMLHVSDAVSANVFCMQHEKRFGGRKFDTATGENISLNEIREIVEQYHPNVVFDRVPERKGDVRETRAITWPLKEVGWAAKIDINTGIHSCFNQILR